MHYPLVNVFLLSSSLLLDRMSNEPCKLEQGATESLERIRLEPSWLGSINWSRGLPLNPEYYKAERAKIFDYWGDYVAPIYDEIHEYRKSFLIKPSSGHHYMDESSGGGASSASSAYGVNDGASSERFITISKNKKTHRKPNRLNWWDGYGNGHDVLDIMEKGVIEDELEPDVEAVFDAFEYDDSNFEKDIGL